MRLFIYLSEILGRTVQDSQGKTLGKLCDVSMFLTEEVFPRAEGLVVKRGILAGKHAFIHIDNIKSLGKIISLKVGEENVRFQSDPIKPEFSLCRDVLDQQVVDTDDQKVVRVNDVHLLNVDNQLYLGHVDVGLRGIVRRLGWTSFVDSVVKFFSLNSPYLKEEELISWKNSQVLTIGRLRNVLRSDVARQKLSKIPATELADIMEDLDIFERASLFKTFSTDLQRKVFADMANHEKEELIDQLTDREAGNLLENIPADEATDLLNNLPKDKVRHLMRFIHSETSKQLRKLLGYKQDTAGGLMTTEYLCLKQDALVRDAMQLIKDNTEYPGNIFFIYIVDDQNRLVGTTSLRRFINVDENTPVVETRYLSETFVRTDDEMEEVALLLEKYKFSSIPVLNEEDVIEGVITSDDVMEELISLTWKKYKDQL
ncbi:MAG: CBS domain-containing protein [Candidatus Zapsychrus exili]|nr:CBS domain-containing protein [Candidatus Zapsychrus exili]